MKMNIICKGMTALAIAVSASACTAGYIDINRNPYGVTDGEMQRDGYAVKAALTGMMNGVISPDLNTAQFTEVLLGCALSGYLAQAKDGWNNVTIANYNAEDDWTNVFMASDRIIPVIYANYRTLQNVTDDPVILAVGEIIKVVAMHRVTDTYGPIPYSKIGQNGEINVPYDSQEDVYKKMFEELNAAIETLASNRTNNFSASADVIYGGNVEKWIKFANSLKLRLAMRICYADSDLSKQMADEAINDEVGLMTSNEDNAAFSYWGVVGNTLRASIRYNLATHSDHSICTTESGDSHAAADIICYMNGYDDPRRPMYFTKTEFPNASDEYVGLRHGIQVPDHGNVGHQYSGVYFTSETAPAYWMNAAEVQFLLAEAAAFKEKGGISYNVPGTAQSYYEQGVRLSFEQYGVQGVETYLQCTSVPTTYTDPNGGNYSYSTQISTITPKWNPAADFPEMQERIITQKWIANWLIGNEAWADWRRTGYPHLIPAAYFTQKHGVTNAVTGARRMPYPETEKSSNSANYEAGVALLGGSGDNMVTRLWFDCNPNHPDYPGQN